jgi:MraZ protein
MPVIRARGRYEVRLDSKGRFPVPARVREALGRDGQETLVTAYWRGRLKVFSLEDFESIESQVAGSGPFKAANEDAIYAFIGNANEAKLDRSGRLRLPPKLREWAGIEREAVVLATLGVLELWNPEALEERTEQSRRALDVSGGLEWLALPRRGSGPEGDGQ